jgi:transcriptional antiterminator
MENKLKGGKADKLSPKDIAKKFDVSVKDVKNQIEKGKKVESEHTDDEEKQNEIASDHVSEFPDYYDRIEKMEKQAEKYWKDKLSESKVFIKNTLRENLK